ncbi:MAG: regulator, partial [Mycobacterium sp.]
GIFTFDGDRLSRCELFDEAALAAALRRFDQLSRPAPQLENAASRVADRFSAYYAAGDWQAMAEVLADNYSSDDRRQVVGSGVRHGRDAQIVDMRAIAEVWITNVTSTVIAIRGERLVLMRVRHSSSGQHPEAFHTETLVVGEINADERIVAAVSFDPDDVDAAFEELERRYLACEATAHSRTWSIIAGAYAALNRHELPAATQDWVNIDHRRLAMIEAGDLTASIRAGWDLAPDSGIYVEAVHRLSNLGAVVTWAGHGTSREGFDSESKGVSILTVDGDLISRCELFDETDLHTALARFEELQPRAPRLENTASQAAERFLAHFAAGDWYAIAEILADNFSSDDRRQVVGAGVRHGRDAEIADLRAIANLWITNVTSTVMAIRGRNVVLMRFCFPDRNHPSEAFLTEVLGIIEINTDGRIVAAVSFDLDDVDAAFAELDARYLAGEAAAHSHTWSVIAGSYAGFNRHERPATTPDWIYIDHRPLVSVEASDPSEFTHAVWELTPDISVRIEAVHRLSNIGAVVTLAALGITPEGFNVEWRMIDIFTVKGDLISRCEMFDEADIDAAIARFDELSPPAPPLENDSDVGTRS